MGNYFSFLLRRPGPPAKGQPLALRGQPQGCERGVASGKREVLANFLKARFPHIRVGLVLCIGMMFHQSLQAQSSNAISVHTYDTVLTSNGFGMYNINVPKFDPDSGTLVSVNLSATVSSQYGFTLTNADNQSATYTLTLGQDDQITGSALGSPFSNIVTQQINTYPLTSGQAITQPPFAFLSNHVSNDSITGNVAPFLGAGAVALNYLSFTYTDLSTVNNATYSYSANINNSIHFTAKYYYLGSGGGAVLATTLTRFSAALTAPHITGLLWAAVNETANRVYDIQRSRDGQNFTTVNSITAQGNASGADYSYTDNLDDSISGNVYYRLQIHDDAKQSYSSIQQVNVAASSSSAAAAGSGLKVFPNPATSYINLQTGQAPGDWQVDIIAASGAVVQRTQAMASSTIYVPFTAKLAAGTYFVRLTGLHGQQTVMAPFVIIPYN
jgi:hypothetical protein